MYRPTRRTLLLLGIGFLLALIPALLGSELWMVWLGFDSLLLVLLLFDIVYCPSARRASVAYEGPKKLFLGEESALRIVIKVGPLRRATQTELRLEYEGPDLDVPARCVLGRSGRGEIDIKAAPRRRGELLFQAIWLRLSGPFGLMDKSHRLLFEERLSVVPNVRVVKDAALRLVTSREFLKGIKRQRYVGDGSEFESLREFTPGYDHRAIDWKASARQRKLLVREFEAERNHRVVLVFDTGHLMSQEVEGLPKLDHAINAGLLLALLSLRQGDRVGLFSFDAELGSFLGPQGGLRTLEQVLEQSARLRYSTSDTNFTRGLAELSARMRRRALIIVLTDFADTIGAEQMVSNLGHLSRRHLVIFVSIRDRSLEEIAGKRPSSSRALHRAVVAADFVRDREVVLQRLRRFGIFCIDATPDEANIRLLNRYLDVKRRGLV